MDRNKKKRNQNIIYTVFFRKRTQTVTQSMYIAADCCSHRDTVPVIFSFLLYSTYTEQILYKLYSLQLNCTYRNLTQPAATQHHTQSLQLLPSAVQSSPLFHIPSVSVRIHSVMSLDRTVQIKAVAWNSNVACSQHHKTHPTFLPFASARTNRQSYQQIISLKLTPLAENVVWQW
jgi:hypothetical protein